MTDLGTALGFTIEQAMRVYALEKALSKAGGDDSPRWIVATAETFRKYIETGELQG